MQAAGNRARSFWPHGKTLHASVPVRPARSETDPPDCYELSGWRSVRTRFEPEDDMRQRKTGGLFLAVYLLAATPALPETSREAAEVVAARHARTCYVEMMDGQLNVEVVR
jgi:hypothetical protein